MASLVAECGLLAHGLQEVQHTGLATPLPVGSSDQGLNHVSCIGRWTLNRWATREVMDALLRLTLKLSKRQGLIGSSYRCPFGVVSLAAGLSIRPTLLGFVAHHCFMVARSRGQVSSKGAPHGHEGLKNKISCFPIPILSSIMPTETKFDIWLFSL